jgi:hypothetical protein
MARNHCLVFDSHCTADENIERTIAGGTLKDQAMTEEDLLYLASARMLVLHNPSDRIELPPPPAAVDEAPVLWQPSDRPDQEQRVPLSNEDDRACAAVMGMWMGAQVLELSRPEPEAKDPPKRPRKDDEDDDREPSK